MIKQGDKQSLAVFKWDSYSRGISTKSKVNGDSPRLKCWTNTKPRAVRVMRSNRHKNRVKIFICSSLRKCSHGLRGQKQNCMTIRQFNSNEPRNAKVDHVKCRWFWKKRQTDVSSCVTAKFIKKNWVVYFEFEIHWYSTQQKTVMSNVALHRYMSSGLRK